MFTNKKFWLDAAERAVKTAAQVAAAFFVVGQTSLLEVDGTQVAGVAAAAAVASLLTSVASYGIGKSGSASALPAADQE